jgi:predicted Zn-dependent peptidase
MDDGPTLIVDPRPGATAAVGLWLRSGSAHELPQQAGITHFLEHLLLRRTASRSPDAIARLIDSLGGAIDAFTTRESCVLTAFVPATRWEEALDLALDAMFAPEVRSEDVESERGVVAAEFDMVQDSPAEVVAERALRACWGDHPLARQVLGERDVVRRLTPGELVRFHRRHFTADRLLAVAVGPVDERKIASRLASLPRSGATTPQLTPPSWRPGLAIEAREGLEQAYVNLVLPGLAAADAESYTLGVLHQLLGAGASSRLFRELRDRRGLVYEVESALYSGSTAGVLEVVFSAPVGSLRACWQAVAEVLDDVANGGISDAEVELALEAMHSGLILGTEACDEVMEAHAGEVLARGRPFDAAAALQELRAVTPERVRALAAKLVRLDAVGGALCGPADGLALPDWLPRRAA